MQKPQQLGAAEVEKLASSRGSRPDLVLSRRTATDFAGSSCENVVPASLIATGFGATFIGSATVLIAESRR